MCDKERVMASDLDLSSTVVQQAMLQGLTDLVRTNLKKIILERIEPDIEAAIDSSLETFKCSLSSMVDFRGMERFIKVIVERK